MPGSRNPGGLFHAYEGGFCVGSMMKGGCRGMINFLAAPKYIVSQSILSTYPFQNSLKFMKLRLLCLPHKQRQPKNHIRFSL